MQQNATKSICMIVSLFRRDIKAGMVDGGMCLCEVLEWRGEVEGQTRKYHTIKIVEIGNPKSKKKTSSLFWIFDRSSRRRARYGPIPYRTNKNGAASHAAKI